MTRVTAISFFIIIFVPFIINFSGALLTFPYASPWLQRNALPYYGFPECFHSWNSFPPPSPVLHYYLYYFLINNLEYAIDDKFTGEG